MHRTVSLRWVTLESLTTLVPIAIVIGAAWKLGVPLALVSVMGVIAILAGLASPTAYVYVVLFLAPLPSIAEVGGKSFPVGFDPLNAFVGLGLTVLLLQSRRLFVPNDRWLRFLVAVNLALLTVAWYRTYGDHPTASGLALLIKPLVVLAAALCVLQLLPDDRRTGIVATAMGSSLLVIGASVVLQRMGVYTTAHQTQYADILGAKQYGGLMLDGNSAGSLFAIFGVPTFLLLRADQRKGARFFADAVLAVTILVLLISLSRSSIVGAAAGVGALVLLRWRRLEGARLVAIIAGFGALIAFTVGRTDVTELTKSLASRKTDPNATLSGRLEIWHQAQAFLHGGHHRLAFGGGLDSFRNFALDSPLHHAFATHSTALRLMTTGGIVMLVAFVVLMLSLWRAGRTPAAEAGVALRVAIVSAVVIGLALDVDVFSRTQTWLWVLGGLAIYERSRATDASATSSSLEDIDSTAHGFSGARTSALRPGSSGAAT
jgi:O-Antigen ligase